MPGNAVFVSGSMIGLVMAEKSPFRCAAVGKVTKVVDDDQIEVEIADDVRVRQMRSMVADVRAKGEPVKEEGASS